MAINSLALWGDGCHKKLIGAIVLMGELKKRIEAFSGELRTIAFLLLYLISYLFMPKLIRSYKIRIHLGLQGRDPHSLDQRLDQKHSLDQ
jgi:hypothetical protein